MFLWSWSFLSTNVGDMKGRHPKTAPTTTLLGTRGVHVFPALGARGVHRVHEEFKNLMIGFLNGSGLRVYCLGFCCEV